MKSKQNSIGLIIAIAFATVAVSGSIIFLGIQMGKSGSGSVTDAEFAARVEKGIEAVIKKQQQEQEQAQAAAEKANAAKAENVPRISADDHVRGNKNAPITIIEYSDFECPFCQKFHVTAEQAVAKNNGKVNWVYRHFPLDFHKLASKKAEASECMAELKGNNAFWQYADAIYDEGGSLNSITKLIDLAENLGANRATFTECLDSGKYLEKVQQHIVDAVKAGINGTPGNVIINNKTGEVRAIHGAQPLEAIQAAINELM